MIRLFANANYDFIGFRQRAYLFTAVALVVSLAGFALRGINYSVEFTGGTLVHFTTQAPIDVGQVRASLDGQGIHGAEIVQYGNRSRLRHPGPDRQGGDRRRQHPGDRQRGVGRPRPGARGWRLRDRQDRGGGDQGLGGAPDQGTARYPPLLRRGALYVPQFYSVSYDNEGKISRRYSSEGAPGIVKRRYIKDITETDFETSIITPETEFSSMYLIEAMRGCPWSCRFCVAGHIYNPFRKKALRALEKEIAIALSKTKRIGIIGPSLSDYPDIKKVLAIPEVDLSITSLRASAKSAELVGLLKGHRSISIAPEAGTERLRRVISKKITEEDILQTSDLIFSEGITTLRLYFMVGLPTETREDIAGIVNLVKKIRDITPKGNLTLSISTFVPKPFTPFQLPGGGRRPPAQ